MPFPCFGISVSRSIGPTIGIVFSERAYRVKGKASASASHHASSSAIRLSGPSGDQRSAELAETIVLSGTPSPSSSYLRYPVPSASVSNVSANLEGKHRCIGNTISIIVGISIITRASESVSNVSAESSGNASAVSATPSPSSSVSALFPYRLHLYLTSQQNLAETHLRYRQHHHHHRRYLHYSPVSVMYLYLRLSLI